MPSLPFWTVSPQTKRELNKPAFELLLSVFITVRKVRAQVRPGEEALLGAKLGTMLSATLGSEAWA